MFEKDPKVKVIIPGYTIPAKVVKEKQLIIQRCGECPKCQSLGWNEGSQCTHPNAPKDAYTGPWIAVPTWCPGRK